MPTKEAINRLPATIRVRLEMYADIIYDYKDIQVVTANEFQHKLRGYLEALKDVGMLTDPEVRCLFLYYKNITKRFR